MKLKTDNIFMVTEVECSPSKVYEALMDEKLHAKFTAMRAKIDPRVGGQFETTDGESFGYILHLDQDKKIVKAWSHKSFVKGHFSIVDVDLEQTESGCRINFNHVGVPEEHSGWLTEGWRRIYWEPLKDFLEEKVLHS
jgi:activator of HSP90 ATPase